MTLKTLIIDAFLIAGLVNMEPLKVGDKARAICYRCGSTQQMTFKVRDVPLRSGRGLVRGVLVGVCDACDRVIAVPAQSVPPIKATIDSLKAD